MILAETKKKAHIVEYILFLWQIEDLVRAAQFDPNVLEKWAEDTANSEGSDPEREKEWIVSMAADMRSQDKIESGHVAAVSETMVELAHLHEMLIGPMEDKRYKEAFEVAEPMMKELSVKQPGPASHPVEQLLVVLYGFLLLRLQKKSISAETESGFVAFRNWANVLAKGHIQIYYGG